MPELEAAHLGRHLQKVVHDYNQILCVVLATAELAALRDAGNMPELAQDLDSVKRAARRGIALTQELRVLGDDLTRKSRAVIL